MSPVIFSNGLTVDQAYSQVLFREEASSILPLICMYDICRDVQQLCIFSSWSSAAFLEEAVRFSLSPCLLGSVVFSGEKVGNIVQCL